MENRIQETVKKMNGIDSEFINSKIKKVLKKMSVKSSTDLENLKDLVYSLYCKDYKQEFYSLCPILIEFEYKDWNTWNWCESMLALMYFDSKRTGDQLHLADTALNKIFAQQDIKIMKRKCDGSILVGRKTKLDQAKELGKKTNIRNYLLSYLVELIIVYAYGGSEKYSLTFLESEILKSIDELNSIF